jgi:putative sterol carrier protein
MTDPTAEFFAGLAKRSHEPLLSKARGSVRFELAHNHATDHWLIKIDKGHVSVSRRRGPADCIVHTDKSLLDGVMRGEVNAFAALLRGAISISGDPRPLVRLQRLFPGPRTPSTPQHSNTNEGGQQ